MLSDTADDAYRIGDEIPPQCQLCQVLGYRGDFINEPEGMVEVARDGGGSKIVHCVSGAQTNYSTTHSSPHTTNRVGAMSDTKYGDRIADDHWDEPDDEPDSTDLPTSVKSHEIDVIHTTDPSEDMGYGRTKYTAHVSHSDDGPTVLHFVRHRWKGNYWRDVEDLDWQDVPNVVRRQVARVLTVDHVSNLAPDCRLVEEGGVNRYEKIHKPRMDAMDSGEMWATSSLRDALKSAEGAAEKLDDSDHSERVESIVDELRETIGDIEAVESGESDDE